MATNTIDYTQGGDELEALYQALIGRQPFRYRAQDDPLYRSYADRYVQNGRMAMRDTMGAAAGLTGGYGSSYAQAAGQQQYDEYLRLLSEALPELYGMAYEQYRDEGAALRERYDLAHQREEDAFSRQQAAEAAAYQRQRDALADERYAAEQESKAAEQRYRQQKDSYQNLVKLISGAGYVPTDSELGAAGMSRSSAEALRREYERSKLASAAPKTSYYRTGTKGTGTKSTGTAAGKSTAHVSAAGEPWVGRAGSGSGGFKGGLSQR